MRRIPYYSRTSKMPVAEFYPVKIRARKIIGIRQNPGSSADETVAAAAAQDCERRRRIKTARRQFSWNNSSMVRLPIRFYWEAAAVVVFPNVGFSSIPVHGGVGRWLLLLELECCDTDIVVGFRHGSLFRILRLSSQNWNTKKKIEGYTDHPHTKMYQTLLWLWLQLRSTCTTNSSIKY